MKPIGSTAQFFNFSKRSHNWGEKMNDNIVKTAVALHASCIAFVDALPGSGMSEGDVYVMNDTKHIYVWVDEVVQDTIGPVVQPAQWYDMTPAPGYLILNREDMSYYVYADGQWQFVWNVGAVHRVVPRELTFYAPYLVRPRATLFLYVASTELTLPAGIPGSGATLEVAPAGDIAFEIKHNGAVAGTVFFEAGETNGQITFPERRVIHTAITEGQYTQSQTLSVTSGADTKGAQGLSMSIRGEIRSIDQ